jgi:urocanate reductase
MKYFLFSTVILVVIAAAAVESCVALGGSRVASGEIYEGTGQGYRGPIRVLVRLSGGSITEIVVADSVEDRFVGGAAIEELIDMVIEYNTSDVDAVSGATESSRGFLEAVENAIMGHE